MSAFLPLSSRRHFLKTTLASVPVFALPQAHAQKAPGEAYEISAWVGPVAGFSLVDTTGRRWLPSDFKGRAVLLNFWASWCEPCRAEMPSLQQVADRYGPDRLLVLAVNFKEKPARARQFAERTGIALPILLDLDGQTAHRWGVKVFPTTLAIDKPGQPRLRIQGELDWSGKGAEKLIERLL